MDCLPWTVLLEENNAAVTLLFLHGREVLTPKERRTAPQSVKTAANKHKQGDPVVPVVAPAVLVRVRHSPDLRTLETCNSTQLTYTDTSLHPHKHLFVARKKKIFFF